MRFRIALLPGGDLLTIGGMISMIAVAHAFGAYTATNESFVYVTIPTGLAGKKMSQAKLPRLLKRGHRIRELIQATSSQSNLVAVASSHRWQAMLN